ncbi:hypothetical protein K435DRAFT_795367 [Dendrothele bispora CBS 962.96]|uniref:non-specific serine/threonine protein kinase n=1 Tax=Dendrothele bispora (strain CBS 962.96) TaxID=1314807 RepID=A0A4S8M9N2_DENBC|nr:hypothetical protein K435DRAFT_795367 [Dendrothele bispora CBS 962.96]
MSNQPKRHSLHWGTDDSVEDIDRYAPGGYHPFRLGDILKSERASYRVLHKLGRGSFSTVWLARTLNDVISSPFVALKIYVADADPQHELKHMVTSICQLWVTLEVCGMRMCNYKRAWDRTRGGIKTGWSG